MTPTLLVVIDLDVTSHATLNDFQIAPHHKNLVSHQHVLSGWRGFVIDRNKKRGPVGDGGHATFLML
jgi:hypothetical protein